MSVRSKTMIVMFALIISCALSAAALPLTEKGVQQPVFPWRDYILKVALLTDDAAEVNHDSGNLMLRFVGDSGVIALSDIKAYAGDFFLRDKDSVEHAPLTFRVRGVGFHDGAFTSNSHQDGFELIYRLDSDSWKEGLSLVIGAQEQQERVVIQLLPVDGIDKSLPVPVEFVGSWQGCAEVPGSDIYLAFTIRADGSGTYAFSQGDYRDEHDITVAASGGTFSIAVPEDNKLRVKTIEGDYVFREEVLTLQVRTSFQSGRVFSYTVPCSRVSESDATEALRSEARKPVTLSVEGRPYAITLKNIGKNDKGKTIVIVSGIGDTILVRNGKTTLPVLMSIEVGWQKLACSSAEISGGDGVFTFETDRVPDAVYLYPYNVPDEVVELPID